MKNDRRQLLDARTKHFHQLMEGGLMTQEEAYGQWSCLNEEWSNQLPSYPLSVQDVIRQWEAGRAKQ